MVQVDDTFSDSFLKQHFGREDYTLYQLAGDASNRRYYRVILDNQSWVLMRWEPFDPNKYPFLSVLNHFAQNKIKVPTVVAMSPSQGFVLLEDLGDLTLERKFWENQNPEGSIDFYNRTVDELIKIHGPATRNKSDCIAFSVAFDVEKLLWELNYGRDNLIKGVCNFNPSEAAWAELNQCFMQICERLASESRVVCHRDYHSRNVMIKFDDVRVIDFQDARMGTIQYDLVSLFKDSYVQIPDTMAAKLIEYYLSGMKEYLPKDFSREHFDKVYELQSIQRCFKACGSFASFYHQRQDRRYLKYISHTLNRVIKSLSHFPEYKVLNGVIVDSGALTKSYENL